MVNSGCGRTRIERNHPARRFRGRRRQPTCLLVEGAETHMSAPAILVIGEHHDGRIRPVSLELVTAARDLADQVNGKVVVAVAGSSVEPIATEFAGVAGVDRVLMVDDASLAPFLPGPWIGAITSI